MVLTSEVATGVILSSYGEQYFANAIPNLRTMCPNIFSGDVVAPEWSETLYIGSATSPMAGAVADDGGVQTNETVAANNDTANDMTLFPAAPIVGDAYYFGDDNTFSLLTINIGQSGVGTWTLLWEYYNGAAWTLLSGITDTTVNLTAAPGNWHVIYDVPSDWREVVVSGVDAYWIRARIDAIPVFTTQPLGTQCWTNVPLAYRDTLLNRWTNTYLEQTFINLATWTTIPLTMIKGILWFIPVAFMAYYMALAVKDLRPALFLVLLAFPLGNLIGMLSLTFTIVGTLICILALGYALFYKPASG